MRSFNAGLRTVLLSLIDFGGELKGDLVTGYIAVSQQQRLSVNAYSALLPIKAFIIVEILLLFLHFVKRLRKNFYY